MLSRAAAFGSWIVIAASCAVAAEAPGVAAPPGASSCSGCHAASAAVETPVPRLAYRIGLPRRGRWSEVFNSDASIYGGSNTGNGGVIHTDDYPSHGREQSAALTLPPLATIVLRAD